MKKSLNIICCLFLLLGCQQEPTYNPFDDQFNITRSQILEADLDTAIVGCGFYNLYPKNKRFTPFYQFYFGEEELQAKGFIYFIDTIHSKDYILDSVKQLDFSLSEVNEHLKKFGKLITRKDNQLLINHKDSTKLILLDVYVDHINDSTYIRSIDFFIAPKSEY